MKIFVWHLAKDSHNSNKTKKEHISVMNPLKGTSHFDVLFSYFSKGEFLFRVSVLRVYISCGIDIMGMYSKLYRIIGLKRWPSFYLETYSLDYDMKTIFYFCFHM